MKTFLTPLQYNEIFSASTDIVINGNVNEEISRLRTIIAKQKEEIERLKIFVEYSESQFRYIFNVTKQEEVEVCARALLKKHKELIEGLK
jgi:hypothetical protein